MSWLVPLLLVVVVGVPLVIAFSRLGELFVLRVREGRVQVVRGRIPPRLLDDIRDVIHRSDTGDGLLRAVVEDSRPQIRPKGTSLSPAVRQQLRNVLGQWSLAKIRAAPRRR